MNLAETIIPKSDQLNADDLITGTITIKVTAIKGSNEPQQPVSIYYENDNGKPYKPCKSMRRVLVSAWGANGLEYVGKSMTLYRDNGVSFGGIQVGGIRISHLSHIENDLTLALTVSRASRKPYLVKRLEVAPVKVKPELTPSHGKWEDAKKAVSEGTTTVADIEKAYALTAENAELLTNNK